MLNWAAHARIRVAANLLRQGAVVAYPTEAVWGLGCDPLNNAAVQRLLDLKGRSQSKGLILIADNISALQPFLRNIEPDQLNLLKNGWPGPRTWLVPDNGVAPEWITGGSGLLALRVTAHPVAAALCRVFGGPLVSTSANPQGLPPAANALKVRCYFKGQLDAIAAGSVGQEKKPTEIRELQTGRIVRAG